MHIFIFECVDFFVFDCGYDFTLHIRTNTTGNSITESTYNEFQLNIIGTYNIDYLLIKWGIL